MLVTLVIFLSCSLFELLERREQELRSKTRTASSLNILSRSSGTSACPEIFWVFLGFCGSLLLSTSCIDTFTCGFLTSERCVCCIIDSLNCWLIFFLRLVCLSNSFFHLFNGLLGLLRRAAGTVGWATVSVDDFTRLFIVWKIFLFPSCCKSHRFVIVWNYLSLRCSSLQNFEYLIGRATSFCAGSLPLGISIVGKKWLGDVPLEFFSRLCSSFCRILSLWGSH